MYFSRDVKEGGPRGWVAVCAIVIVITAVGIVTFGGSVENCEDYPKCRSHHDSFTKLSPVIGFHFDPGTMVITVVDSYGSSMGVVKGAKIMSVDGVAIRDAAHYLSLAKHKSTFTMTISVNGGSNSTVPISTNARWEWKDTSRWKSFSKAQCAQIESAYATKSSVTIFPIPGRAYIIDTGAMTQTNTKSGFSRPIRRPSPFLTPGGWKAVYPPAYDPEKDEDPVTFEPLGDGKRREVVELQCSTAQVRCILFKDTIVQSVQSGASKCPICSTRFAIPGPQPSGTMTLSLNPSKCAGFSNCGSIVLNYNFPGGTQGKQHYHPGNRYAGTSRTAYLPDNAKGRDAMALLIKAFEAGILFRVGKSVTTGRDDQTVWGGVHQKTSYSGGTSAHGWPDDSYFSRLVSECAAAGVFSDKWLAERAKERKKHRMARQISEERKRKKEEAERTTKQKDDDEEPSPSSATKEVDASTKAKIERAERKIAEINKDIQAAMQSMDRAKIKALMQERKEMQELVTKLQHEPPTPKDGSISAKRDEGAVDRIRERMSEINKAMQTAMRSADRSKIKSLMRERAALQAELVKFG
eukprot:g161.t1